jgi:hypothetical protein
MSGFAGQALSADTSYRQGISQIRRPGQIFPATLFLHILEIIT